jgi:chromosome segregation ATPase
LTAPQPNNDNPPRPLSESKIEPRSELTFVEPTSIITASTSNLTVDSTVDLEIPPCVGIDEQLTDQVTQISLLNSNATQLRVDIKGVTAELSVVRTQSTEMQCPTASPADCTYHETILEAASARRKSCIGKRSSTFSELKQLNVTLTTLVSKEVELTAALDWELAQLGKIQEAVVQDASVISTLESRLEASLRGLQQLSRLSEEASKSINEVDRQLQAESDKPLSDLLLEAVDQLMQLQLGRLFGELMLVSRINIIWLVVYSSCCKYVTCSA